LEIEKATERIWKAELEIYRVSLKLKKASEEFRKINLKIKNVKVFHWASFPVIEAQKQDGQRSHSRTDSHHFHI